jgi:formate dehydrogenase subunit gamma
MPKSRFKHGRSGHWRLAIAAVSIVFLAAFGMSSTAVAQANRSVPPAAQTPTAGKVPGRTLGNSSDAEIWRAVRRGIVGRVSIPDQKAAILVQSEGESWRAIRDGPLSTYGAWAMLGIIVLLAVFFALRGRIRVEYGSSGQTITRFSAVERTGHWLTASSFVLLALTGLNILYGRYVLRPILGPDIFAAISYYGKYVHNFVAFAFMVGLVMVFVTWVRHNIPDRYDLTWLAKGGGMFVKGVHPPATKFNAGQKVVFWLVVLGGLSISLSGISMLFPFQMPLFAKTFAFLNIFGFDLPTNLTALQEMQLSTLWHAAMAIFMIVVILAHIYIGTLGMEGAFDAMGTGEVDLNWAKEHHSIWAEEHLSGTANAAKSRPAPAE